MRSPSATLVAEASGISDCLDRLAARKREGRPLSVYRLQFHRGFQFEDARKLLPYLDELGISHCYSSPILKARAGSTHGYDITDHNALNPDIGSAEEFYAWVRELESRDMGQILDIVPNHMGVGYGDNPWWQDVLENGRASAYADFFDIDWNPLKSELRNKVLLPVLGDQYGEELEQGRIRLGYEDGRFALHYYDKKLPVDPQTWPLIFEPLGDLRSNEAAARLEATQSWELQDILNHLRHLPPHSTTDPQQAEQRRQEAAALKRQLAALAESAPGVRQLIERAVELGNGQPGNSRSFDALHRLLEAQAYRLAHWRVSAEEINYRRFFDINDLIGLRMENAAVFAATHKLLRRLLAEGSVCGLRIDHPDGLFNPRQYFTRLQMLYAASQCCGAEPCGAVAENGIETQVQEIFGQHDWMHRQAPLYVVVEKILEPGEALPGEWPVDGTSGYEFLNLVNGIFIDRGNARTFTNLYRRFLGDSVDVDQLLYDSKKLIMHSALASEVTVLGHMLDEISSMDRRARDFTRKALSDAIREVIAGFPVYRTYIDERGEITERDRSYIAEAIVRAKRRNPSTPGAVYDFLRDILLLKTGNSNHWTDAYRSRLYFTLKFQQLTGPVMAKSLEDTVCYVYNRLVSLNEVGGSPKQFGVSVDDFHRENLNRAEHWPTSMLATSTHDSKRSEDVRARLNVLSEMPKAWSAQVMRWRRMNRARRRMLGDGRSVPDYNEEYLLYQTLVGTWPWREAASKEREEYVRRMQAYLNKAVHEAKVNLSWINPNPEYIEALEAFIARLLSPGLHGRHNLFLEDMEKFAATVGFFGAFNSLSQTLLKLTSPGVPDIYQGNESWDFSVVDPDNRRAVDFAARQGMLAELRSAGNARPLVELCEELLRTYSDGRIKMWVTMRVLCFRREHAELFRSGAYVPLYASGERQEHVVGFARALNGEAAVTVAPRLVYGLCGGQVRPPTGEVWGNTELLLPPVPGMVWENVLTGERFEMTGRRALSCSELFGCFPLALLASR